MEQHQESAVVPSKMKRSPWLKELLVIKFLIEKHPVLAGASALLLPSISIYHYTMSEHVPLSIASPDVVSSLPSVLAAIAFLVVVVAALPLIPVSLMFEGVTRDSDGRLRVLPGEADQRKKEILHWLVAFMFPGICIAAGVCTSALWLTDADWPIPAAAILASVNFTWIVLRKRRANTERRTWDTVLLTFAISFLQMLIAIYAMQFALKMVGKSPSNAQAILALAAAVLLLPLVQMFAVRLIEHTSQRYGFVMQAFIGATFLIAAACLIPPSGAFLAGHVIAGSASGYTPCTQLKLSAQAGDFTEIADSGGRLSVPLKILSDAGGSYLVRKSDSEDQTVYRIPDTSVIALSPCPSKNRKG